MSTRTYLFSAGLSGLFLLLGIVFSGCGGLPDDFESLSLEEKVAAYEEHWSSGGTEIRWARRHIAWHGWAAADLMAQYVKGERVGIPVHEAIVIIQDVQLRGCSLQGSAAESALQDFLETTETFSPARLAAMHAIEMIRANSSFDIENFSLKGGPCQPQTPGSEQAQ